MMIIAPLSLYGVFTGGPEGPVEKWRAGENELGSSFHLVQILQNYLIVKSSIIRFSLS